MTSLVQGSLIESSPCRVLTLEYLKDVRRRLFGTTSGPIQVAEALEIARSAGASSVVVADVIPSTGELALSWRLMDTLEGTALGAGRCRSSDIFEVADRITVLRLGQQVAVLDRRQTTQQEVVHAITAGDMKFVPGMDNEVAAS